MSEFKNVYADLPDGTRKKVRAIDFYNRYVTVVDYMAYDDLNEWILDEVDIIFDQPTLNENQQIVLEWLKDYYKENRPFTTAFGAIRNITFKRWAFIKQNLTEDQQEHVLELFSKWAQEQEAE